MIKKVFSDLYDFVAVKDPLSGRQIFNIIGPLFLVILYLFYIIFVDFLGTSKINTFFAIIVSIINVILPIFLFIYIDKKSPQKRLMLVSKWVIRVLNSILPGIFLFRALNDYKSLFDLTISTYIFFVLWFVPTVYTTRPVSKSDRVNLVILILFFLLQNFIIYYFLIK